MSDTNRFQLRYVEEPVFGTTPASALTDLRNTGESLSYNISTIASEEIRSDRQITDLIQTTAESAGVINLELSYSTYDDFLKAALFSSGWSTTVAVAGTDIAADNSGSQYTSTSTDFTTENIVVGQWIKVAGFTAAGANGYFKVTSVAANALGVTPAPAVEAATNPITMAGSYIRNETTQTSFSLEKEFSDITQFISYVGMIPSTLDMTVATGSVINGSIGFIGLGSAADTSTIGTGSPTAANTNEVMNAVDNIGFIWEGGSAVSGINITEISQSLNNNLRGLDAVGTLGHVDIGDGQCMVTGTLNAYFADTTIYEKYLNATSSSISFRVNDAAGNSYIFTYPRIEYTTGNIVAGSANSDVMANMGWQATRDSTTDATIQIDRFVA